jgi:hypothetical protein
MRQCLFLLLVVMFAVEPGLPVRAQQPPELIALVNQTRVAAGLPPLRESPELSAAAQRQSADMAATGQVNHGGSDGSTPDSRVTDAGYGAYAGAGPYISENLYAGASAEAALAAWQDDASSRTNLLSPDFREFGAGFAESGGQTYFTLVFGARPNVLPVFVDDDASETGSLDVVLTLTNETIFPAGDGTDVIGRATEVRISNQPGFPDAAWRAWAATLPWTLAAGEGLKTVYVQFRDEQGRTTGATDSIVLASGAPVTASPTAPPGGTATGVPPSAPPPAGTPSAATATAAPGSAQPPAGTPPAAGSPLPPAASPGAQSPAGAPAALPDATGEPAPAGLLAAVCVLQLIGVALGGYVVLRRGPG